MSDTEPVDATREACKLNSNKNVFVVMRYETREQHREIEQTIKETLRQYGLTAIIARDSDFHEGLWENVKFCMDNSQYGIVIFEDIGGKPTHNPNVALELGYMMALNKRCLILKEESLEALPTDVIGRLYRPFSSYRIRETMGRAIEKWLENVLGSRLIKPAETITSDDPIEARKMRTHRIVELYERILKSGGKSELRLAALLTALAVSPKGYHQIDEALELPLLYLREKELLLNLIERGVTVRCIISPRIYEQRVHDNSELIEEAKSYYLPRYETLIETIRSNLDTEALQIVWAEQLPRNGLIISDNNVAFVGTRTTHDYKTRTTIIHDPALIEHEMEEFEYAFEDTIMHFRSRKQSPLEGPALYRALKLSLIEELEGHRDKVRKAINALERQH